MINYNPGVSPLHRLNGATKVAGFIVMTVFVIMTYDVRVMAVMFFLCAAGIISMKPNWKPIFFVIGFMTITAGIIGSLMVILIKPGSGLTHVGAASYLVRFSERFYLTRELLWYVGAMFFKRLTSLATALVFILAITPSELASGLNVIGLPYKACIIISLAFRTIPDIARNFVDIKNSMMIRGMELDPKRAGLFTRLSQMTLILVPLLLTSFSRVDTIANAMDLRRFGKLKKRTWYSGSPPSRADWAARLVIALLALFCVYYIIRWRIISPAPYEYWCPWVRTRA
jgi:energy-coupling factor transport system permease protein